ncbi:KEOPS complex subunit Cgi121 [Pyrococcus abyssi]|nr:KEOPS complex subunit Cgi121 [Pyrococcus abyssi]
MLEIKTKFGKLCIAKVKLASESIERALNLCNDNCQIVSAKCHEEVIFATILAIKAFSSGRNTAKTIKGEILLRLAGVKQIKDAIKIIGARKGENLIIYFGVSDPCSSLKDFISSLGLREEPLKPCDEDEVKRGFERAAIIEAL